MNSACPVCDRPLGASAKRCRCGWIRKEESARPHVDCAYAPHCTEPAIFRKQTVAGFVCLCQFHDEQERTRAAEAWCLERGLNSTQDKIAFCREQMKKLMQPKTVADYRRWMDNPKSEIARKFRDELLAERRIPVREPGEDEDERAAA